MLLIVGCNEHFSHHKRNDHILNMRASEVQPPCLAKMSKMQLKYGKEDKKKTILQRQDVESGRGVCHRSKNSGNCHSYFCIFLNDAGPNTKHKIVRFCVSKNTNPPHRHFAPIEMSHFFLCFDTPNNAQPILVFGIPKRVFNEK